MPSSHLTIEQKLKAVNSVYSNKTKYSIASFIYDRGTTFPVEIMEATNLKSNHVSNCLSEMVKAGVVTKDEASKHVYYRLTELGKKIMSI